MNFLRVYIELLRLNRAGVDPGVVELATASGVSIHTVRHVVNRMVVGGFVRCTDSFRPNTPDHPYHRYRTTTDAIR